MQELRVTNNEKSPPEKTIINIFFWYATHTFNQREDYAGYFILIKFLVSVHYDGFYYMLYIHMCMIIYVCIYITNSLFHSLHC